MKLIEIAVKKYDIIKPGGSLTLTSGTAALKPGKGASTSAGLNGGVISLTKGLAGDLAQRRKSDSISCIPDWGRPSYGERWGRRRRSRKPSLKKLFCRLGSLLPRTISRRRNLYLVKADYATGTYVEIGMFLRVTVSWILLTHYGWRCAAVKRIKTGSCVVAIANRLKYIFAIFPCACVEGLTVRF